VKPSRPRKLLISCQNGLEQRLHELWEETSNVVRLEGRRRTLLRWSGERGIVGCSDVGVDVGEMRKEIREAGVHVEVLEEKAEDASRISSIRSVLQLEGRKIEKRLTRGAAV